MYSRLGTNSRGRLTYRNASWRSDATFRRILFRCVNHALGRHYHFQRLLTVLVYGTNECGAGVSLAT